MRIVSRSWVVFGTYEEDVALARHFNIRLYLRQQPVMLGVLSVLVVIFFLFVSGPPRAYYAQRHSLGTRCFNRGIADLEAKLFPPAVTEFRTALLYSRD